MIKSFADKVTIAVFSGQEVRQLAKPIQQAARRKLAMIDAAVRIDALRLPPSNRLELLKGDRKGQHSIRINQQWRICFRWEAGHAWHVEIVYYH